MRHKNALPVRIYEVQGVKPLPGSDFLEIVKVAGRTVVTQKGELRPGGRAIFVSPGYNVPVVGDTPFYWMNVPCWFDQTHVRVEEESFFGVVSEGIAIPVPGYLEHRRTGARVGRDLGITRN